MHVLLGRMLAPAAHACASTCCWVASQCLLLLCCLALLDRVLTPAGQSRANACRYSSAQARAGSMLLRASACCVFAAQLPAVLALSAQLRASACCFFAAGRCLSAR
jgi:hypothetical protein